MKTVGELREFIKDLPDDMLIVQYRSNMEKHGYENGVYCDVANMQKETKHTWDRFDGTDYSYEVFVSSEDGVPCLKLSQGNRTRI